MITLDDDGEGLLLREARSVPDDVREQFFAVAVDCLRAWRSPDCLRSWRSPTELEVRQAVASARRCVGLA
jgi:hypothetical protein